MTRRQHIAALGLEVPVIRRSLRALFAVVVVGCLTGADDIRFDKDAPRPNPDGEEKTLLGKGTYSLEKGHELTKITFFAKVPDGQWSNIPASTGSENWSAKLQLFEGEYEVWVEMHTRDKASGKTFVTATKPVKLKLTKPLKL